MRPKTNQNDTKRAKTIQNKPKQPKRRTKLPRNDQKIIEKKT